MRVCVFAYTRARVHAPRNRELSATEREGTDWAGALWRPALLWCKSNALGKVDLVHAGQEHSQPITLETEALIVLNTNPVTRVRNIRSQSGQKQGHFIVVKANPLAKKEEQRKTSCAGVLGT